MKEKEALRWYVREKSEGCSMKRSSFVKRIPFSGILIVSEPRIIRIKDGNERSFTGTIVMYP
jgi:hypothetical protein